MISLRIPLISTTALDKKEAFVPAMLLQPYVENSIRHGIRHLEDRKGIITIAAAKEGDYLVCRIDDNGIGRERAQQLPVQNISNTRAANAIVEEKSGVV